MEGTVDYGERRRYPRISIDLPLEYRGADGSCFSGGMIVNASERGLLIQTARDIPVGMELNVTVLFPFLEGLEFANFKVMTKIIRKERYRKEDKREVPYWERYQYGLELIRISEEDRLKLNLLLRGGFEFEESFQSL